MTPLEKPVAVPARLEERWVLDTNGVLDLVAWRPEIKPRKIRRF